MSAAVAFAGAVATTLWVIPATVFVKGLSPPQLTSSVPPARAARGRLSFRCRHCVFPLRSSLEEVFEAAPLYNETSLSDQHGIILDDANSATAGSDGSPYQQLHEVLSSDDILDPASILNIDTANEDLAADILDATFESLTLTNVISSPTAEASTDAAIAASERISPQQQFQEVLSSEDLLDPATILDATIGITDVNNANSEGLTSHEAMQTELAYHEAPNPLRADDTGAAVPSIMTTGAATAAAKSKEDDVELTRQAILKHIQQMSMESDTQDDEDEDESTESDNLQQLDQRTEESQLTSLSESTPSIAKILKYTIPAIGIWLCSPVLSMIDTAAVGLLSGTAQQAALNPAVSVTDFGALVVAFMYTATTNLIATAVQEDKDDNATETRPKTTTTLITGLKLALVVGLVFGTVLGTSGKLLLKLLIGNDALDPMVFSAALQYVRIRALGVPAMVLIGTAQSACLGMQDVTSPLYVLLAAAAVNFLGDVLLVPRAGSAMFGGAAGAAWATVASQYAALLFFARWLTTKNDGAKNNTQQAQRRPLKSFWKGQQSDESEEVVDRLTRNGNNGNNVNVVNVTQGIMELTGTSKAGRSRRKEFRKFLASSKLSRRIRLGTSASEPSTMPISTETKDIIRPVKKSKKQQPKTRGFLSDGKLTLSNYFSFSKDNFNLSKAKEFLPFVVPVTTTSVGRISGYIAMSHVASSTLGTYDMAGHQIVFSIFCCLTPFVDALSQVAQSFVPAVFEAKGRAKERALALRKTINNFRKVGFGFGVVLMSLVACIPLIGRYFTTDLVVLERVNSAIPGVGLFMIVNGLMCAGEGTLLGQKDLKFLRNMYTVFFFTVPAYMLRLKHRSLTGVQAVSIGTMWAAFSTYNVIRTSLWHLRLAQLQRRTDSSVAASTEKGNR